MNTGYMSVETRNDVVVIGGGAAGMMAALFCAREGAKTLLLERNEKLGKKIYITGKGRCNLTNTAEPEQFLREIPHNGRFMLSPLSHLNNEGTIRLFNTLGLATKVERGGRVFPVSDKASDVTKTLHRALDAAGVKILLNSHVERISCSEGLFTIDTANGKRIFSSALILATGGASYPATGSTGDGYRFAEAMGHRVYAPVPSLVGMNMNSAWHERLQGLTLKNVTITAKTGKKVIYHELGEVLFTHFGISGPLILTLSAHMPDHAEDTAVTLNMKPGMTPEELDKRLIRELTENSRKQLNTILNSFFPQRLAGLFPAICGLNPEMFGGDCTRADRKALLNGMTALPLPITGPRSLDEAIITRGGVDVKSITPGTMMSKQVPGLFFAGELIDVDAHTGGFNLQIAWSTGALAGQSAAAYVKNGR